MDMPAACNFMAACQLPPGQEGGPAGARSYLKKRCMCFMNPLNEVTLMKPMKASVRYCRQQQQGCTGSLLFGGGMRSPRPAAWHPKADAGQAG